MTKGRNRKHNEPLFELPFEPTPYYNEGTPYLCHSAAGEAGGKMKQQTYLENAIEQLKENPIDVCVIWPFSKISNGHAQTSYNGKRILVHRLAYQLYYGEEPKQLILHKCGNPACYNPEHLYDGNHKQNTQDIIKHRGMFPGGRRKLTEDDVLWALEFLRNSDLTHQQIADCLGVSRPVISAINTNRTWKHVPRSSNKLFTREDHTSKKAIILQIRGKPSPIKLQKPDEIFVLDLTEKEIETAKGLLLRGFKPTEVADWLNIPRSKVKRLLSDVA
jgi:plasmid maintenance system antidote protein VapI